MRLPTGFRAGGVAAGLKPSGKPDLVLVASDRPCAWALATTRNLAAAASVQRARRLYSEGGQLTGLIVNAGNANCVTGEEGSRNDARMAELAAGALRADPAMVLTASTGVIGRQLPVEKVEAAVPGLAAGLSEEVDSAADAILTTDLVRKVSRRELPGGASVVGMAKGSGMIHPDMATMLAFIFTDAPLEQGVLRAAFPGIVARTFNAVTVDGDTSTNDMAVLMANGAAGETPAAEVLAAVEEVMRDLARAVARDGEGATKLITVRVAGAPSDEDALRAARTVAGSSLLKSAVHGNDPNWGRVLAALGRSGVSFDPARARLSLQGVPVFQGFPLPFDAADVSARMRADEVVFDVDLAVGTGRGEAWGCDLSAEYVRINADYTT
jgi:glutamate N-acetyltransferase/amino-acid N-acetyltransferase